MTIQHIKYFIITAECLSFTQAAEQLFITQPSLSRQITAIESELNVLLFIRNRNHTIELTPAGSIILEEFKKIYDIYGQAVEKARRMALHINDPLKIGILQGTYVGDFMPGILRVLSDKYPNVHVSLRNYSFGSLTRQLYGGELDMIITLYFSIEKLDNLCFHMISPSKDYIVMNKDHPLAHMDGFTLNDLMRERLIILSEDDCEISAELIRNEFKKSDVYPEFVSAPDVETMTLWVEAGYGVAILDSRSKLQFNSNIVFRAFESSWDPSLAIAWHRDNKNPMIQILIDLLKQRSSDMKGDP